MLRVAIVDDEVDFIKTIESLLRSIINPYGMNYSIDKFIDGKELLNSNTRYDLLLLDIEMPTIDGFNLVEEIKNTAIVADFQAIIYISNYDNFIQESIKHAPFRFVRKSNLEDEFEEAVNAFLKQYLKNDDFFTFTDRDTKEDITLKLFDIVLFEAQGHDIRLVIGNNKDYTIKRNADITLEALEKKYSSKGFIRSHKTYLVNYRHIYRISDSKILFTNGGAALISRKNIKEFKLKYQSFVMKE